MDATRIVVISPSGELGTALSGEFSGSSFDVVEVRPGPALVKVLRRDRPRIAVIDRIDERLEAAQLEIALLKEFCPGVIIIARSDHSSEADASIVEQGIFYYAAAAPVDELIRVIHAAARAAGRQREQRV